MTARRRRVALGAAFVLGGATLGAGVWARAGSADATRPAARAASSPPSAGEASGAPNVPRLLRSLDPLTHHAREAVRVADLGHGFTAILTLDSALQQHVEDELSQYDPPFASVVALDPESGRVLAYVSHSSANPSAGDLARDPTPPAASVFKIITAAALVDAGVTPETRVCYGGGFRRLTLADLTDNPRRDRMCSTLAEGMGGSINAVFAKLAVKHLNTATLDRYAAAFGFGHALPFDVPTRPSPAEIPDGAVDTLEFARTAAGFWHMHMSPLHASLIAAAIANDGDMARPILVERIEGPTGRVVYQAEPSTFRPVVSRATARAVGQMMERTVTDGTSRRAFHDGAGRPFLPGVRIAGKTGTLSGSDPYRGYTWWVGFAPADDPKIAVAALVVNTPLWRIKAGDLAKETLEQFLRGR